MGGSWGSHLIDKISAATSQTSRPVPVRATTLTDEPSLSGARAEALARLQSLISARPDH